MFHVCGGKMGIDKQRIEKIVEMTDNSEDKPGGVLRSAPWSKTYPGAYDMSDTIAVKELKVYREAAHRLGIELVEKGVRTQEEAQKLLAQLRKGDVDGILSHKCCSLNLPGFIVKATFKQGILAIFESGFWVEEHGALVS